jgi:ubiquinone/menaquinone biosynthesis C-methylase UbiE
MTQHRDVVREAYARTARSAGRDGCCVTPHDARVKIGYTREEMAFAGDANLGVGCGAPHQFAKLAPGERACDLGCGAGVDVLLAARCVGADGVVVGVDMTPEMLVEARARAAEANARAGAAGVGARVEFRLGALERLPCRDGEFDVVMSNCVINLCEDKRAALAEAFRALKPGGRLCVADVVSRGNALPEALKTNEALAC